MIDLREIKMFVANDEYSKRAQEKLFDLVPGHVLIFEKVKKIEEKLK